MFRNAPLWYQDADGDGYGNAASSTYSATQPSGYVDNATDCDDGDSSAYGIELCGDGVDNDCDGTIDEDDASDALTYYQDTDGDGYGSTMTTTACSAPSGYVTNNGDCDDTSASIHPGAVEVCDDADVDENCDGTADDGAALGRSSWYADTDADGYGGALTAFACSGTSSSDVSNNEDCDDASASIHPGVVEVCDDADVDENCDGTADGSDASGQSVWYADADGDGYGDASVTHTACNTPAGFVANADDCNDSAGAINPIATEICDDADVDENCDGSADGSDASGQSVWYADADGDGYGDASVTHTACNTSAGFVANADDCNDSAGAINPIATEVCDDADVDENCDGTADGSDASGQSVWYADADGDGYGNLYVSTSACDSSPGFVADSTDCNDTTADAYPTGTETCDLIDNDCDGETDEDVKTTYYLDADGDGYGGTDFVRACSLPDGYAVSDADCDDTAADFNPAASETCGETRDLNCDGSVGTIDSDGDGYFACAGGDFSGEDCDDSQAGIHPDATEVCDSADVDENCDGSADDTTATGQTTWYADVDGDFYGDPLVSISACDAPKDFVANNEDCNDADGSIKPGVPEICDAANVDEDCNGTADEAGATGESLWYADADADGYGDAANSVSACDVPTGYVNDASDCDDTSNAIYPGAEEVCGTAIDNNCDGIIVDVDTDDDGYVACGSQDCNDANANIHPDAVESCDGVDNDCDGNTDEAGATGESMWYADADADGYGDAANPISACAMPMGYVSDRSDCDDTNAAVHPDAAEVCANSVDDDCDVATADGTATAWFRDRDGDGFGNVLETLTQCGQPAAYVANADDCNDTRTDIHPDAEEICDTLDNNCDSTTDEDVQTTYFEDADGDGYGDAASTSAACDLPAGFVTNASDCDDTDAALNPETTDDSCTEPSGTVGDDDDATGDDDNSGDDDETPVHKGGGGCILSAHAGASNQSAMCVLLVTLVVLGAMKRMQKFKQ